MTTDKKGRSLAADFQHSSFGLRNCFIIRHSFFLIITALHGLPPPALEHSPWRHHRFFVSPIRAEAHQGPQHIYWRLPAVFDLPSPVAGIVSHASRSGGNG